MARDTSINLLRKQQKSTGFHLFLQWLLTYGRIIIIVVQTIALAALVYRYFLDRELETVRQHIKDNQVVIQERKDKEDTYRTLHERLALVETIRDSAEKSRDLFVDIISTASGYMVFKSASLDKNTVRIEADTPSIALFNTFVKKLREDDRVDTVNIGNIKSKSSNAIITVDLTVSVKKGALGGEVL